MRRLSMLKDTVELYLYIGEYDDEAQFQKVTLQNCYCVVSKGTSNNTQGKAPADNVKFYIFDCKTVALSDNGTPLRFIPYEEWEITVDKSKKWTLCDRGKDYFRIVGSDKEYRIVSFSRKKTGRRRMWHFEVIGK